MTDLRKLARGQACTVRLPGCSKGDVVLAHIRRPWNAGTGMKPPDTHGVYACGWCHDIIDRRRVTGYSRAEIDSFLVDALLRTRDAQEG